MRKSRRTIIVISLVLIAGGGILLCQTGHIWRVVSDTTLLLTQGIHRDLNVMVPMRDGVRLATTVLRPADADGVLPTILTRTTYGGVTMAWQKLFVEHGYAVVIQHVRGRSKSEGTYSPHRYSRADGYDTIDWIVQQPWSNGRVGTFGCSYLGENQAILAAGKHPAHLAMITGGGGGAIGSARRSYGYFGVYENGVLNLASALGWFSKFGALEQTDAKPPEDYEQRLRQSIGKLPVASLARRVVPYATGYDEVVTHALTDEWWHQEGYISDADTFGTAGLHVNTWFDQTVHDTFRLARLMEQNAAHERARHQYLLIGPGEHCSSGKLSPGRLKVGDLDIDYNDLDYEALYLNWYNHWLKDERHALPPKFHYYMLRGAKWETSQTWPPDNTRPERLYLASSSQSSNAKSGGILQEAVPSTPGALQYVYDPSDPVPTRGGTICCTEREEDIAGPVDQRPLLDRQDVLVYQTSLLDEDKELVGNARAVLYVSTSAPDTDFTVKLVDDFPDGRVLNLQDGVVRLRYREGVENPKLAQPGEVYTVEIVLRPIAYRFAKGHRIALHISSSNFPRLARNLNTGEHEYKGKRMQKAVNKVFFDASHPSFLELPIRR